MVGEYTFRFSPRTFILFIEYFFLNSFSSQFANCFFVRVYKDTLTTLWNGLEQIAIAPPDVVTIAIYFQHHQIIKNPMLLLD